MKFSLDVAPGTDLWGFEIGRTPTQGQASNAVEALEQYWTISANWLAGNVIFRRVSSNCVDQSRPLLYSGTRGGHPPTIRLSLRLTAYRSNTAPRSIRFTSSKV